MEAVSALAQSGSGGIEYECIRCGSRISVEDLAYAPDLKCPHCGYKVLRKTRQSIVKRVKAR